MQKWLIFLIATQLAGSRALAHDEPSAELRVESRISSLAGEPDRDRWMAIVGDSGVTGAASDPDLTANVFSLVGQIGAAGVSSVVEVGGGTTGRVFYSSREWREARAAGRGFDLRAQSVAAAAVDRIENSFGYDVARGLGIDDENVVMVGQDGKRVSSIPTQLERIYEVGAETLPPLVLMSYTANDFCDPAVFTDKLPARVAAFERSLREAWDGSRLFLKAHPRGTEFVVLAPLDVSTVLTNPGILDQRVPLGVYGDVTCRDLREGSTRAGPVAGLIARRLVAMCPAVLGTKPGDVARLRRLREVQDGFGRAWQREIARLNRAYRGRGLSWRYVEGTARLGIGAGDVANECFHPSAAGHRKIAAEVLRALAPLDQPAPRLATASRN